MKTTTTTKILLTVGIIIIILSTPSLLSLTSYSFSELYKNFDGSYLSEKQYEESVLSCSDIQRNKGLDSSIDCADFVLTKEGNDFLVDWMLENRGNWLEGHVGSLIDCDDQIGEECITALEEKNETFSAFS